MSRFSRKEVTCGHCGSRSLQNVYSSVNANRSPSLRENILAGRFHRFECPFCRESFVTDSPFVYVDVTRKQWLVQNPRSWGQGWRKREAEAVRLYVDATQRPHAPRGAEALFAGTTMRLVFGLAALREKILCLDAGIDDVALEALKLDLMRSVEGLWLHPDGRPRLDEVSAEGLTFVAIPPGGGDQWVQFEVDREASLAALRVPGFEELFRVLGEGSYVDVGRIMYEGGR